MTSDSQTWSQYWMAQGDAWHLSIFRILWNIFHIGFALYILRWTLLEFHLPTLPYPSLLSIFALQSWQWTVFLTGIHFVLALLLLCGWNTRLIQVLIALSATALFFRTLSLYHNHYAFYLCITWYMTLVSSERFYSLDAYRKKRLLTKSDFSVWQHQPVALLGQRLILLQLSLLYMFAGLNKMDPSWFVRWSQTPELISLTQNSFVAVLWQYLLDARIAWIPLVCLIGLLLVLSVGVFFASRYPLIAFVGIGMHLIFDLILPVISFTEMCSIIWLFALFPIKKRGPLGPLFID
ncbi:MAG: HTTM domain-containing protein [bacterium]|nr:HTTM domain-containing protein [bacterium]